MQITRKQLSPTEVKLSLTADAAQLQEVKKHVLRDLGRDTRLQGFRPGKAPLSVVERNVDQNLLQSQFLDHALNQLFSDAVRDEKLRPVAQPKVTVTKFVPFTTLEVDMEVETVGSVKLPDYKKIRLAKKPVKVEAKDIDDVIENLRSRGADTTDVKRAAKDGDQIVVDFMGTDAKTGDSISGADGKEYPVVLGSNSFIPGFEPELIGLKAGDDKIFTITFPKDYGVAALQSRKVTFSVKVHKVQSVARPKIDDAFAATVGPFKTVAELKADIRKQLQADREQQSQRDYESELLEQIANQATVGLPKQLVDEEIDRHEQDERQNLTYRGQTWQEHLKEEGLTEAEHRERQRPSAELRGQGRLGSQRSGRCRRNYRYT